MPLWTCFFDTSGVWEILSLKDISSTIDDVIFGFRTFLFPSIFRRVVRMMLGPFVGDVISYVLPIHFFLFWNRSNKKTNALEKRLLSVVTHETKQKPSLLIVTQRNKETSTLLSVFTDCINFASGLEYKVTFYNGSSIRNWFWCTIW
jgi:hypothetical protein